MQAHAGRARVMHIERIKGSELIRTMQAGGKQPPCLGRQWCDPRKYRQCAWKGNCGACLETARGLILSANIIIGYQLASLLGACGWRMQVVNADKQAFAPILQGNVDVVIADIDASDLGGMAVLVYCKHHRPSITTFALTRGAYPYLERLAYELAGCEGFFYLSDGKLEVDTRTGMAARLLSQPDDGHATKATRLRRHKRGRTGVSAGTPG
jgi:CheY-like chemotaxis protein